MDAKQHLRITAFLFLIIVSQFSWAKSAKTVECVVGLTPPMVAYEDVFQRASELEMTLSTELRERSHAVAARAADRLTQLQGVIDRLLETPQPWELVSLNFRLHEIESGVDSSAPIERANHREDICSVEMRTRARKDYLSLAPYLQAKYDEFEEQVRQVGLQGLDKRWALERLLPQAIGVPEKAVYSVRLNHGYRVVIGTSEPGQLIIYHLSKTVTHFN